MRLIFRAVLVASILSAGLATPVHPDQRGVAPAKSPSPTYTIGIFPFQDMSGGDYGESFARVLAKQLQPAEVVQWEGRKFFQSRYSAEGRANNRRVEFARIEQ